MGFGLKNSILVAAMALGCTTPAPPEKPLPNVRSWAGKPFRHGVVTTSEPLAAKAGAEVLAKGGNAIDAAITAMFMLNVVEPQDSGIGGGAFILVHLADSDQTRVLNCRELSPEATTSDMFVSQPDASLRMSSGYAVGVPGAVACAAAALDNWGTISLAESLQPAIEAASGGVLVSSRLAAEILSANLDHEADPSSPVAPYYDVAREVFRPGGVPIAADEWLVQEDLATTLELIAAGGPDAFYHCGHPSGIAEAIVAAQLITRTANPDGVGRMTCEDLESYEIETLDPIARNYRGHEIVTIPPPSSGGIALLQQLAMLERFPIGEDGFGFGEFATLHVMLEAMRLSFADRAMWVGDERCPECFDVPLAGLLNDDYLAHRAQSIHVGRRLTGISAGDALSVELGGNTTHLTVIDEQGNIVALTASIEATWGTGLMVPDYGFLLNNQLTDFNVVPTFNPDPEAFNPGANDPASRKRPLSSMAPTIIFVDGEPVAAMGSPGGSRIINAVVNVMLNLIDHRMTLTDAVDARRISVTSALDSAVADWEAGLGLSVRLGLQALGYSFAQHPGIGAVQAILRNPHSGNQTGAADFRRIGGVFGP